MQSSKTFFQRSIMNKSTAMISNMHNWINLGTIDAPHVSELGICWTKSAKCCFGSRDQETTKTTTSHQHIEKRVAPPASDEVIRVSLRSAKPMYLNNTHGVTKQSPSILENHRSSRTPPACNQPTPKESSRQIASPEDEPPSVRRRSRAAHNG